MQTNEDHERSGRPRSSRVAGHTQGRTVSMPTRDGRAPHGQVLDGPPGVGVTVVFEAGIAASRSTWALVQPRVARFARAVVYDRSGLGRSAPDPGGRTLGRMADDLGDVLQHHGPGPFVLVGHSAGGPIVRLAASRRPDHIAGLVLADPTDEATPGQFGPLVRVAERVATTASLLLARLGLFRPLYGWLLDAMPAADFRGDLAREGFTVQVARTHRAQARTFLTELAAWRTTPPELGGLPVTIISGTRAGGGMPGSIRRATNRAHAVRAAATPQGRHVLAEHSGHYVPITDPQLVVEEIRRLVGT